MNKDKSLRKVAITIKGKKYVQVADRIVYFNENYESGCINTEILTTLDSVRVVIRATVIPDFENVERKFVAHSQAKWGEGFINKTSAIENAETSAVGRALAMMGIGVIESIASVDEIHKASAGGQDPKLGVKKEFVDIKKLDAFMTKLRKREMTAIQLEKAAEYVKGTKYEAEVLEMKRKVEFKK